MKKSILIFAVAALSATGASAASCKHNSIVYSPYSEVCANGNRLQCQADGKWRRIGSCKVDNLFRKKGGDGVYKLLEKRERDFASIVRDAAKPAAN